MLRKNLLVLYFVSDPKHLKNPFLYRVLFVAVSVSLSKWKYYFGWKLGE